MDWTVLDVSLNEDSSETTTKRAILNMDVMVRMKEAEKGQQEIWIGYTPNERTYAALVDYQIKHLDEVIFAKERALWCPETNKKNTEHSDFVAEYCVFHGHSRWKNANGVKVEVRSIELLPIIDMTQKDAYRNFLVKSGEHNFYVNTRILAEHYGGTFFDQWNAMQKFGHVGANISDDRSMRFLFDACVRYDRLVIHDGNFMNIGWCALSIGSEKLMRAVEQFVIDLKGMHPVKKIEISAELLCARLFHSATNQLGPPAVAHRKILEYAHQNNLSLDYLHPALQALSIVTPEHIITT
ncbi:unnamed protein product, partial [Mesorhabditis belari]|uniref:Uncharacterized protein n=1 Tax=Mesorhabditis belari TaxID=2138241 RepID=A0AAF3EZB7_9BILA